MQEDPILLVLVFDDYLAPKVLAWWKAEKAVLADIPRRLPDIARVADASVKRVQTSVERCQQAGLLLDGGISPMAEKWIGTLVAQRLGAKRRGKSVG